MIRQLEEEDSIQYFNIRLEGLQMHPEAFGTGAEDWSMATDAQVKSLLEKSNQDDFVLGYFQEDELVGVIGLKREKKHSVMHKGTVWGLMVRPNNRKLGIGKSLLEELIARASLNKELKYLRAVVTISELGADIFFKNCGFTSYGVESRGIKNENNFFDQSFMMLNLGESL